MVEPHAMKKQPKRRVKGFSRKRGSKVYRYAWVGYSKRNAKGTPTF